MTLSTNLAKDKLAAAARFGKRYSLIIFFVFMASIYGFLSWQVVALNQVQPDPLAVAAKLKTVGVPHIDQTALDKIQQLQDNSVEVQSLFDQARSNPFKE